MVVGWMGSGWTWVGWIEGDWAGSGWTAVAGAALLWMIASRRSAPASRGFKPKVSAMVRVSGRGPRMACWTR